MDISLKSIPHRLNQSELKEDAAELQHASQRPAKQSKAALTNGGRVGSQSRRGGGYVGHPVSLRISNNGSIEVDQEPFNINTLASLRRCVNSYLEAFNCICTALVSCKFITVFWARYLIQ